MVGILGIRHRIAERTAGRRSHRAAHIAVTVAGRGGDKGDIDMGLPGLDRSGAPAMGPHDHRVGQHALRQSLADRS